MPHRTRFLILITLALLCLLAAASLTYFKASQYDHTRRLLPPGTTISGIPVGSLPLDEAGARLIHAYTLTPVELVIQSSSIHIDPITAGQKLDLEGVLDHFDAELAAHTYWAGLWDYLWNRQPPVLRAELSCSVEEATLRAYLTDLVGDRYARPATQALPLPGDSSWEAGQAGEVLDIETAIPEIRQALCDRSNRSVTLHSKPTDALPPTPDQLRLMLEALLQVQAFDGTIELYYEDLQTGDSFSLASADGQLVDPDIAFTAASTIKIPVMVSVYKQIDGELPADLRQQMALMIDLSDNNSTDDVMQRVLDANLAPIQVTQDAQAMGLKNTFLAGFFYPGAPLLDLYQTPANQRTDLSTDPDIYNQTTTADMGRLLAGIQHCAAGGTGIILETFPTQITSAECQEMVDLLLKNRKGVLIETGLPEGTPVAHKYGWVTNPATGLLHQASDAALVFTSGGDFVLTIYMHQSGQLQWDPAQRLTARLTTAVYNYHNQWR